MIEQEITNYLLNQFQFDQYSRKIYSSRQLCFLEINLAINSDGDSKLTSIDAICALFKPFSGVILNACYSQLQAKKLSNCIPYVIGMNDSIGDKAAINFAIGFYTAVGAGKSIPFSYEMGKVSIQLENIEGHEIPILIDKNEFKEGC